MASLAYKNGRGTIQHKDRDGKRRTVRLGATTKKSAQAIRLRVNYLEQAILSATSVDPATAEWVASIGDDLHAKLAKTGLVPAREKAESKTLGEFLDWLVEDRGKTRKQSTLVVWRHTRRCLVEFFGKDRPIESITPGDAESWREWLMTTPMLNRPNGKEKPLSVNTVRRRCGFAKQFFKVAARKDWIAKNPFEVLEGVTVRGNRSRDYFLTPEDYAKIIEAAPDSQWRVIIALARYGGLRTPSETLALRWSDILWEQGKIVVTDPKRSHHDGKETRVIPLFPEIREHLNEAWDLLGDDPAEHVVTRYRDATQNLRTQFTKIIKLAGLKPWPKLFHNLRASRQTELAAAHPAHVVCEWIGNSEAVAKEHYLRVQESDFSKALHNALRKEPEQGEMNRTILNSKIARVPSIPSDSGVVHPLPVHEWTRLDSNQ